jgi:hypothetical protein
MEQVPWQQQFMEYLESYRSPMKWHRYQQEYLRGCISLALLHPCQTSYCSDKFTKRDMEHKFHHSSLQK